jgi:hypothetical protein
MSASHLLMRPGLFVREDSLGLERTASNGGTARAGLNVLECLA